MCGSIALAGRGGRIVLCLMILSFVRSVGLDADCIGQLSQGRPHALVYPFGCA